MRKSVVLKDRKIVRLRPLTPNQLQLLEAFYFGEVRMFEALTIAGGKKYAVYKYMWDELDVSGRVQSLKRRKLIRFAYVHRDIQPAERCVLCTDAGRQEIEKCVASSKT